MNAGARMENVSMQQPQPQPQPQKTVIIVYHKTENVWLARHSPCDDERWQMIANHAPCTHTRHAHTRAPKPNQN